MPVDTEELAATDKPESYWALIWRKFRRHHLAVVCGVIILIFYVACVGLADFIAPYSLEKQHRAYTTAPPTWPRFVDTDGDFHLRPFVYGYTRVRDEVTFEQRYEKDPTQVYPVHFLVRAEPYRLFGLFETDIHLFGVAEGGGIFLLGTNSVGGDTFSRVLYGGRVSLTVGFLGMLMTLIFGAVIGTLSGYFGGKVDTIIQRVIELMLAFPRIPLWMALAAAVPRSWSPVLVYFMITVILAIISWGGLARQIRGMVLSLREREFVAAAQALGASHRRIILRYLLPNTASHMIVIASLAIPDMILGETALSFLGLGLRPPVTSWGVLMQEAQNIQVLSQAPWLLTPALAVVVFVLAANYLGDGLRDAADPYSSQ